MLQIAAFHGAAAEVNANDLISFLKENNIEAYIQDSNFSRIVPHLSGISGGLKVMIHDNDAERFELLLQNSPSASDYIDPIPEYSEEAGEYYKKLAEERAIKGRKRTSRFVLLFAFFLIGLPIFLIEDTFSKGVKGLNVKDLRPLSVSVLLLILGIIVLVHGFRIRRIKTTEKNVETEVVEE